MRSLISSLWSLVFSDTEAEDLSVDDTKEDDPSAIHIPINWSIKPEKHANNNNNNNNSLLACAHLIDIFKGPYPSLNTRLVKTVFEAFFNQEDVPHECFSYLCDHSESLSMTYKLPVSYFSCAAETLPVNDKMRVERLTKDTFLVPRVLDHVYGFTIETALLFERRSSLYPVSLEYFERTIPCTCLCEYNSHTNQQGKDSALSCCAYKHCPREWVIYTRLDSSFIKNCATLFDADILFNFIDHSPIALSTFHSNGHNKSYIPFPLVLFLCEDLMHPLHTTTAVDDNTYTGVNQWVRLEAYYHTLWVNGASWSVEK